MKTLILILIFTSSAFGQARVYPVIPIPFTVTSQLPSTTTTSTPIPWPEKPNGEPYPSLALEYSGVAATTINPVFTILQGVSPSGPFVKTAQNVVATANVSTTTDRQQLSVKYSPYIEVQSVNPSGTTTITNMKTAFFLEGHN